MPISTGIETITPAIAEQILLRNDRNRPLSIARAENIAAAILRGEWALNGDAVRISKNGALLDGQHRLTAIVKAGVAVDTVVVRGLPDEVFSTIDVNGRSRSSGDVLAMSGFPRAKALAAAARLLHKYEKTGNPYNGSPDAAPTTQQISNLAKNRPELSKAVNFSDNHPWCCKFLTGSLTSFCCVVFDNIDSETSAEFFSQLESGAGLAIGSPILLLRDRLVQSKTDKTALTPAYKAALVFKAFKLFCAGTDIKTLRVRTGGEAPEKDTFDLTGLAKYFA